MSVKKRQESAEIAMTSAPTCVEAIDVFPSFVPMVT